MASARAHARIARSADDVWKVVGDPDSLPDWFPGIDAASTDADGLRTVTVGGGTVQVKEQISRRDDALRRMQYSIVDGPMPVTYHCATIDVLDDGDSAVVVYAVDYEPAELSAVFEPMPGGAVQALAAHLA
jgi:carbon monoxide dehydrogenase subunit G